MGRLEGFGGATVRVGRKLVVGGGVVELVEALGLVPE
jgi:hypothetical protein